MLSIFKSGFQYKPLSEHTDASVLRGVPDGNPSPILIEEDFRTAQPARITRLWLILAFFLLSILVSLNIVQVFESIQPTVACARARAQEPRIAHCGSTPGEARALGCKFEVHNFAWVSPDCYDDELAAEWDADPSWTFARSMTADPEISPPDLYTREEGDSGDLQSAVVPWRQHVAHCAFIVRKYQRAVMMNWPMDNWTYSYPHMKHCVDNFLNWDIRPWDYNSVLHLKFPVCDYRWQDQPVGELHEWTDHMHDSH